MPWATLRLGCLDWLKDPAVSHDVQLQSAMHSVDLQPRLLLTA